jgi:hypothetical protein
VQALTDHRGAGLAQPVRRDTSHKAHAITSATAEANIMVKVPWHLLFASDAPEAGTGQSPATAN